MHTHTQYIIIKIYFFSFFLYIRRVYIVPTQIKNHAQKCGPILFHVNDKIYFFLIHCSYRNCWSVRSIRSTPVEE